MTTTLTETTRLGLIGDNIADSKSPRLHELAGRLLGRPTTYDRLVPRPSASTSTPSSTRPGPKATAASTSPTPTRSASPPASPSTSPSSPASAPATPWSSTPDGPRGYNTDWSGFKAAYRHGLGDTPTGAVCMIGAGGVGKAVAFGLIDLGMTDLRLVERDLPKAEALAEALRAAAPGLTVTVTGDAATGARGASGLVNCTPVGMVGYGGTPLPRAHMTGARLGLRRGLHPRRHPVPARDAAAEGLKILSGYELYFYQGLHAISIFHGRRHGRGDPARSPQGVSAPCGTASPRSPSAAPCATSSRRSPRPASRASRSSRPTSSPTTARPPRSAAWSATSASSSSPSSPSATSRACPSRRARTFDRARRKLEMMAELGAPRLGVCSNVSPHALGGIDRAADDLRALGDIAAPFGIEIAFEALAWGRFIRDWRDAWEVVRRTDHPAVKLLLDSFHALAPGYPVEPMARDPRRPHLLRPARRRAGDRHGRPPALPPPPPLPRPGRPPHRRLHGRRSPPPASTAGSATRSSTTASAWPRPAASPPTASARSSP